MEDKIRKIVLVLGAVISFGNIYSTTYYVSPTGHNSNSGLTPSLAWRTISYAAGSSSPVVAGDIVYVKAGTYSGNVVFSKSGTAGKPITFQGYKATPGDTPPLLVNSTNPFAGFLSTDMPLLNGGNRTNGIGFNCQNQKYLVIKNFQIQNYAYGLIAGSPNQTNAENLTLYNINTMFMGDTTSSYSGEGILLGEMGTKFSNNDTITNCLVVNSSAEGFGVNGDKNMFSGCKVYCNENSNSNAPTDYYMIVCGSYNTITNCYIERAPGLLHSGHGFSVKSNAEQVVDQGLVLPVISPQYNKFSYCTAKNMGESFCVRHRPTQNNSFYHCKATGTHTGAPNSPGGEGNCIVTRDGASNNTFDGCIAENCNSGFIFVDTSEDGDTGTGPTGHPGNNNKFINCLINNCYIGVNYSDYGVQSDAGNNTIANCTFYKTRYLHYAARHCANMKYIGNIYDGCLPAVSGGYFKGSTYAGDILPNGTNTYFKNCDFINIEGGMPLNFVTTSIGSIAIDPLFINPGASDFHLKAVSLCIDKSITVSGVTDDLDGFPRPQGVSYDMGAYEFQITTSVSSITSPAISISVFPNPTQDILNIVTESDNNSITIFDLTGKSIYKIKSNLMKTELDLHWLADGMYFLLVENNESAKTFRIVLSK